MLGLFVSQESAKECAQNPFCLADDLDCCMKAYLNTFRISLNYIEDIWLQVFHTRQFLKDFVNGDSLVDFLPRHNFDKDVVKYICSGLRIFEFNKLSDLLEHVCNKLEDFGCEKVGIVDEYNNVKNERARQILSEFDKKFRDNYDEIAYQTNLPDVILNLPDVRVVTAKMVRPLAYRAARRFLARNPDHKHRALQGLLKHYMELHDPISVLAGAARIHHRVETLCVNCHPPRRYEGMIYHDHHASDQPKTAVARWMQRARREVRAFCTSEKALRQAIVAPPRYISTKHSRGHYFRVKTDKECSLVCDTESTISLYDYENREIGRCIGSMSNTEYSDIFDFVLRTSLSRNLILIIDELFPDEHLRIILPLLGETQIAETKYLVMTESVSSDEAHVVHNSRYATMDMRDISVFDDSECRISLSTYSRDALDERWQELGERCRKDIDEITPMLA